MNTLLAQPPVVAQAGDLRAYQGGYFRVLVAPAQTHNAFGLIEFALPRGAEPPRHVHTREDETFYVLEGEIAFCVGDARVVAQPGQAVFAPRLVPHQFNILSPEARMLTLLSPGNFLDYFMSQSAPLTAACPLVPPPGPPPAEVIEALTRLLEEQHGVLFQQA